jgi:hypothetical protein
VDEEFVIETFNAFPVVDAVLPVKLISAKFPVNSVEAEFTWNKFPLVSTSAANLNSPVVVEAVDQFQNCEKLVLSTSPAKPAPESKLIGTMVDSPTADAREPGSKPITYLNVLL